MSTSDLRLSDFGSSLLVHPSHHPTDGVGLGTLPFSAPELVDPSQSFSFPVDIFAMGATLYQCLSGVEPYRGLRSVEMMHQVRRGGLWDYEDKARFNQMGARDLRGGPYPSAWRDEAGVKRGGSLRLAMIKPKLVRQASEEIIRSAWARDNTLYEGCERQMVEDGSFIYLDGREEVSDHVCATLKSMLSPDAEERPTAAELCRISW
jgi:serine/threonine protein kinase